MKRYAIMIFFVLVLALLMAQLAHAQGPVTPPPHPPVVTPTPGGSDAAKKIDEANSRAAQWQQVANQTIANAQASINAAYGALANAQWGLSQAQTALAQEQAARIAAQQGQIQQAVDAAQNAQLYAANAIAMVSQSSNGAMESIRAAGESLRGVVELKTSLTTVTAQRDAIAVQRDTALVTAAQYDKDRTALAGQLVAERQRSDLYGKLALAAVLMLLVLIAYIALVLAKLMRALKVKPSDRVVVLNERGQVRAEIEALH